VFSSPMRRRPNSGETAHSGDEETLNSTRFPSHYLWRRFSAGIFNRSAETIYASRAVEECTDMAAEKWTNPGRIDLWRPSSHGSRGDGLRRPSRSRDWRERANDDLALALAISAWQVERHPIL